MKLLWAVSSVGKGHVMRSIAVVNHLQAIANIEIDWLAPDPAADFLQSRGYQVLEYSSQLKGSGKAYNQVFAECTDEFNLMDYIRHETKLHRHDFMVSKQAWDSKAYDVIIGDEAFWLLSGFSSRWAPKPAPFIFITDFIGTKAMRFRARDLFTAWKNNLAFSFSYMGADEYIYIGDVREIPDERFGILLPNRRSWAKKHCRFVRPIVDFIPTEVPDKHTLRQELGLPESKTLFLATIGPEGYVAQRVGIIEQVFEGLKDDYPDSYFTIVCPESGTLEWIHYHRYLDNLHQYFAASDFVIIQSGYGKIAELSALGIPFIAIPLDYHFEQEWFMGHRLSHYGIGKLVKLRDNSPRDFAEKVSQLMNISSKRIAVDNGVEVADIILRTAEKLSERVTDG